MKRTALTLIFIALAGFAALPAHAIYTEGNPECQKLLHEGDEFRKVGKMNEALHSYADAAHADPASSAPASRVALLYFIVSTSTKPELVEDYRNKARAAAEEALRMEPTDHFALAVIRQLDNGVPVPRHTPKPDAYAELHLAEASFQKKQYDDAIAHYQKAVALDPQYDVAYVYMGDCYYATARYPEAEANYRHATELDPMNSQAWRFLSDALIRQGKFDEVPQVLANGIAVAPNDIPSWDHLEAFLKSRNAPMQHLNLQRHASYDPAKKSVNIDPAIVERKDELGLVIWMAYGMGQANASEKKESPFAVEYDSWHSTFAVLDERAKPEDTKQLDPAVARLYQFYKDGQLKPALLVLAYRESWRPDFEAWKKDNPQGVKTFIDTYHVRP